MPPRILVTGGAGFIGSHVVRLLAGRGDRVRVLERPGAPVEHLLAAVDVVVADIRDRAAVARALPGCREVYHIAGIPHLWIQPRGLFHQVNYLGAVNVLEEALAAGAKRILHVSSETILTRDERGVRPLPWRDLCGPYCRSKHLAEKHALTLARRGAPIVIASPTVPIGPGDMSLSPPTRMLLDFCQGRRREYIDGNINLIDVRDVAEGLVCAMSRGRPGRRYVVGHESRPVRDIFARLARLTGLPVPQRRVPFGLALAAAYVSEWVADVVTHRPPAATVTGVRLTRRLPPDPRPDLEELGLRPRSLDESLVDVVQWFRSSGHLACVDRSAA